MKIIALLQGDDMFLQVMAWTYLIASKKKKKKAGLLGNLVSVTLISKTHYLTPTLFFNSLSLPLKYQHPFYEQCQAEKVLLILSISELKIIPLH